MLITSIIFFASLVGIILMIALKARRLKLNIRSRWSHLTHEVDARIRRSFRAIRVFISYFNRRSAIALLQWIAYHILSWIRSVYMWIHMKAHAHPHSRKVIDMVKGKGKIEMGGGASFYLKRISTENSSQGMK